MASQKDKAAALLLQKERAKDCGVQKRAWEVDKQDKIGQGADQGIIGRVDLSARSRFRNATFDSIYTVTTNFPTRPLSGIQRLSALALVAA
jgi:hypothetical protein